MRFIPRARPSDTSDGDAELRAQLPALLEEAHGAGDDGAARAALRQKLASLKDDAELIGDGDLVAQADAAVKELDAGGTENLAAV